MPGEGEGEGRSPHSLWDHPFGTQAEIMAGRRDILLMYDPVHVLVVVLPSVILKFS